MIGQTVYTDPKEITNQIGQFFYSNSNDSSLNPDFLKFKETQEMITLSSPTTTTSQGSILNDPITMSELNSSLEGKKKHSFQVRVNEHMSEKFDLENGVPQGSPLSILLFQAAINNLPDEVSHPVKSIMFADDTHIYLKGKNIKSMTRQFQDCLNDLSKWCFHSGFIFSPEKTKCIMFTKKKQISKPKLFLGNTPLPFVNNIKILGLIFDSKLTWKPHISKTKSITTKSINILKTLSHAEWGAESNVLINLYRSLVRSKLDYGSICYSNANPNILKTIDVIHISGLRVATGAFRSSPILSILSVSGEPPLHIRRIKLALNYIARILSSPENSTLPFLTQIRFANTFCSNPNLKKTTGFKDVV
ncbi:hypothetical protein AGLY_016746 [Aphis glycines]|uniref:Reverse transcriptase domain-containing protein n=1 Tax=Aphis glycines TaxID=307491 RepID=A0A6G0SYX1_APHGL|nr:hypothetical protein AGLY_016746 [Aphis glycines]